MDKTYIDHRNPYFQKQIMQMTREKFEDLS